MKAKTAPIKTGITGNKPYSRPTRRTTKRKTKKRS